MLPALPAGASAPAARPAAPQRRRRDAARAADRARRATAGALAVAPASVLRGQVAVVSGSLPAADGGRTVVAAGASAPRRSWSTVAQRRRRGRRQLHDHLAAEPRAASSRCASSAPAATPTTASAALTRDARGRTLLGLRAGHRHLVRAGLLRPAHGLRRDADAHIVGVADRTLPCGTPVSVSYDGRPLTLPVIDRGPYGSGATLDLTQRAAQELGVTETVPVGMLALERPGDRADELASRRARGRDAARPAPPARRASPAARPRRQLSAAARAARAARARAQLSSIRGDAAADRARRAARPPSGPSSSRRRAQLPAEVRIVDPEGAPTIDADGAARSVQAAELTIPAGCARGAVVAGDARAPRAHLLALPRAQLARPDPRPLQRARARGRAAVPAVRADRLRPARVRAGRGPRHRALADPPRRARLAPPGPAAATCRSTCAGCRGTAAGYQAIHVEVAVLSFYPAIANASRTGLYARDPVGDPRDSSRTASCARWRGWISRSRGPAASATRGGAASVAVVRAAQLRAVVARVDAPHRARARAHHQRLGRRARRALVADALEHVAVGDAGRGEEAVVAGDEVVDGRAPASRS